MHMECLVCTEPCLNELPSFTVSSLIQHFPLDTNPKHSSYHPAVRGMHDTLRLCYCVCKGCIEVYNTALEMDIAKPKLILRLAEELEGIRYDGSNESGV